MAHDIHLPGYALDLDSFRVSTKEKSISFEIPLENDLRSLQLLEIVVQFVPSWLEGHRSVLIVIYLFGMVRYDSHGRSIDIRLGRLLLV